ncbi:MAG: hypothetical protein QXG35_08275, partial [Nitrososphaerota archaeon]
APSQEGEVDYLRRGNKESLREMGMRLSQPIMVVKNWLSKAAVKVVNWLSKLWLSKNGCQKVVVKIGCQRPLVVKILVVNLTT